MFGFYCWQRRVLAGMVNCRVLRRVPATFYGPPVAPPSGIYRGLGCYIYKVEERGTGLAVSAG